MKAEKATSNILVINVTHDDDVTSSVQISCKYSETKLAAISFNDLASE